MNAQEQNQPNRLTLIDIFKIICAFYIVVFHTGGKFIPGVENTSKNAFTLFPLVELLSEYFFYYSGLFILAISFFLIGYNNRNLKKRNYVIFGIGILLTQASLIENPMSIFEMLNWGVFSFIICAYGYAHLSQILFKNTIARVAMLFAPMILVVFPSYIFSSFLNLPESGFLKQMFVGEYLDTKITTGWYLIPWISYPLFFFGSGLVFKLGSSFFKKIQTADFAFLIFLLAAIYIQFNKVVDYKFGAQYDRIIFQNEGLDLLPLFIFPLIIFRLSLHGKVQNFLNKPYLRNISELSWAKYFWLCYASHFIFLAFYSLFNLTRTLSFTPYTDLLAIIIFLSSAVYAKAAYKSTEFWKSFFSKIYKSKFVQSKILRKNLN